MPGSSIPGTITSKNNKMEQIKIVKEKIPAHDPRLKRFVYHDSRSLNYKFDTSKSSIINVTHTRYSPILDQGQVGSCTGNAGIGAISCDPLYSTIPTNPMYALNESGAVRLYSAAETIDGDGPYPPNDNGSCGLSIAKALKSANMISSYQHVFSANDALLAASQYPFIFGTNWYSGMFNPDADGRVHITGSIAGGHEILCRQVDATNRHVWFDNSWGTSWGVHGRFYLTFDDFNTLMSQQGDVIIMLPDAAPAPAPVPTTSADIALAAAMRSWLTAKGL
jgi:hypothetical protein